MIPALLVFGPVGDALCRRRVLMAAILIEALGILFLCVARGIFWLLLGRLLVGIGGLFVALVPSYVSSLLQVRNIVSGGVLVALMLGMSVVGQLIMRSQSAFRLQVFGLGGGIVGLAAVVWAWPLISLPLMFIGSVICGVSTGLAYLGSISELNRLALPEERGSINSLYFVIIYLFFSVPIIGLGLTAAGLGLFPAVRIFSAIVAVLFLVEII